MKRILFFVLVIFSALYVRAQSELIYTENPELATIRALWIARQYSEVFTRGKALREALIHRIGSSIPNELELGIPALDYMIFTSMCLIPEKKAAGCRVYHFLYSYDLPQATVAALKQQQQSLCGGGGGFTPNPTILATLGLIPRSEVQGSFKTFDFVFGSEAQSPTLYPVSFPRPIVLDTAKYADYIARRIRKDAPDLKVRIGRLIASSPNKRVYRSANFIFLTGSELEQDTAVVPAIAQKMEGVLAFYYHYFQFPVSDYYFQVYLTKNLFGAGRLIDQVYGVHTSESNPIGYSNYFDNAIFACLPRDMGPGTVKHELIHLLIRSSFGNIPGWFEEGLASLYEESAFSNDILLGKPNWRGKFLRHPESLPTLSHLFTDTVHERYITDAELESAFTGSVKVRRDITTRTVARLQKDALSRYFFLFAQDHQALQPLYIAFKTQEDHLLDDGYLPLADSSLVLPALGYPTMQSLQTAFTNWLRIQVTPTFSRATGIPSDILLP